jgi:hypothetical protein
MAADAHIASEDIRDGTALMNNPPAPLFIIGGSRTGSEMLKTMLSASSELDFVDELFLLCPLWLHRDLNSNIARHVGDLSGNGAVDRVVELLYSGIPYGWFFSVGIHELDREMLRELLSRNTLGLQTIFEALMVVHSQARKKKGIGAKFPLHYSYSERLLEWFPNCRLIHTTRNPKGTYASQAAKYIRGETSPLARNSMRFKQFVHINIQISWTARIHGRLKHLPNYCLVRYEDVVLHPEQELRRICEFIGTDFVPGMLSPHQYGSSFDNIGAGKGIDSSSLDRWKTSIQPITAKAIDFLHPTANSVFGYRQ